MDNDRSDEQLIQDHIHSFIKSGIRESSNDLLGAAGAAIGFARGGPVGAIIGGAVSSFVDPIASAAGHTVAKGLGLERRDDED